MIKQKRRAITRLGSKPNGLEILSGKKDLKSSKNSRMKSHYRWVRNPTSGRIVLFENAFYILGMAGNIPCPSSKAAMLINGPDPFIQEFSKNTMRPLTLWLEDPQSSPKHLPSLTELTS